MNHFEKMESYLPVSLLETRSLILAFFVVLFFVVFRYFLMVLPFHFVFYILRPQWSRQRQIYPQLPGKKEQFFELKWSLYTSVVFAVTGVLLGVFWEKGWSQIYLRFDQFGLWYLPVSWLLLLAIHDTYFYWTHRWLHVPGVYERFHAIHHASLRPSPWASFSFHPVESILNAIAIPIIALVLPLHPVVILLHLTFMTLSAITNHSGFEILPRNAMKKWWGAWVISGVHHTQHHRFFRSNYGLFFTAWDRWMDTEHAGYEKDFEHLFKRNLKIETQSQVDVASASAKGQEPQVEVERVPF